MDRSFTSKFNQTNIIVPYDYSYNQRWSKDMTGGTEDK